MTIALLGIVIGLLVGAPLGFLAAGAILFWLFITGHITTAGIAEICDRLISADLEPTEAAVSKRTTL